MDISIYAARFAALGHAHRLQLFQSLVQSGDQGLAVGELQAVLGLAPSTLAFHLRELVDAGLVTQQKDGRSVRSYANFKALDEVMQFVRKDCCKGVALPAFAAR